MLHWGCDGEFLARHVLDQKEQAWACTRAKPYQGSVDGSLLPDSNELVDHGCQHLDLLQSGDGTARCTGPAVTSDLYCELESRTAEEQESQESNNGSRFV